MCFFRECRSRHSGLHINNAAEFIPIEPFLAGPHAQSSAVRPAASIVLRYWLPPHVRGRSNKPTPGEKIRGSCSARPHCRPQRHHPGQAILPSQGSRLGVRPS